MVCRGSGGQYLLVAVVETPRRVFFKHPTVTMKVHNMEKVEVVKKNAVRDIK